MHVTPYGWAYIAIALILCRVFAGAVWRQELRERETLRRTGYGFAVTDDMSPIGAFFLGVMGGIMWPVVLTVWGFYKACVNRPELMFRIFFHEPSRERRERLLNRRREQTARLEKELGIDA